MDEEHHSEQSLLSFSSQTFLPELCGQGLAGGLFGCGDSWKRKDANRGGRRLQEEPE